ncbi:Crp/Fnr family transcriptional regulator [Desulfoferula mesophila]|uniref:Crp/Fnr family transcriptional regulator n=1 Tax=Desulfoferula mesophila TaxID=3058419 RepID=A0AAU9EK23_9BACT|nr:Crp/Fnr family transcriptional regulator [Desulfoferula mesophilus]
MPDSVPTADPKGEQVDSPLEARIELFQDAMGFSGIPRQGLRKLAALASLRRFCKGQMVFEQDQPCDHFHLVASGLVKVYICSASGSRMTYLLARRGEPLNLIGPFTGDPRFLCAEAMQTTEVAHIPRQDFVRFVAEHPVLFSNIMAILSKAVDSANSRLIDMVDKKVEERLLRVLLTLLDKFGSEIKLTSTELAELAGTTVETTLRTMARLRSLGIISSERGQITIIRPTSLKNPERLPLWV